MPDYPILLQLDERLCVVVGGGPVGRRKARGLVQAGARVRLVDAEPGSPEEELNGIEVVRRPYRPSDLEGAVLVFAATGDREVNAAVALEARRRGILFNVADAPDEGDFTLPALLRRGGLTVAVSTGGQSPALAALARDHLSGTLGPEWGTVLEIAAALRQKRLTLQGNTEYNQAILRRLLDDHLPELVAGRDTASIDCLLKALFGEGFSLAELGIHLPKGMT